MPHLDPTKLVFMDETATSTKRARRDGRAPRHERGRASVPPGHGKTTTWGGGLRLDGLTAPRVLDGAMEGAAFRTDADSRLGPRLAAGDLVGLDHRSAHQVAGVEEALAKSGARVWSLPPDSPDFTPMEQVFAKLKALLHQAAARTVDGLEAAIAAALEAFSPEECANDLAHAGYRMT